METVTLSAIDKDIKHIMKELTEIKKHMVDVDYILTSDDLESLREAERDLMEGKTKRLV